MTAELPAAQLARKILAGEVRHPDARTHDDSRIAFPSDRFVSSGTITLAEWRKRHAAAYGEVVEDGAA